MSLQFGQVLLTKVYYYNKVWVLLNKKEVEMLKQYIRPTTLVRNIMKSFGKNQGLIFTNTYEKCRTVKCYGGSPELELAIRNELTAAGVSGYSIKRRPFTTWGGYTTTSFIVRIPRSEQA
jgi:hypothetical protein